MFKSGCKIEPDCVSSPNRSRATRDTDVGASRSREQVGSSLAGLPACSRSLSTLKGGSMPDEVEVSKARRQFRPHVWRELFGDLLSDPEKPSRSR